MKANTSFQRCLRAGLSLALAAAGLYGMFTAFEAQAETRPPGKPAKKKLDGAQLYAVHCARCHSERYATEHTEAEWKTLMMHMRVRANLPAVQAKAILKYLQEEAGK